MADVKISEYQINAVAPMQPVSICGISGRFPESSSASEFYCNLVSGMDMVTDDERKWARIMHTEIPQRCGKMKAGELSSFDAQFFGIHGQQAKKMDPQLYKLLEVSWEAWMDSGIDVRALRDSNRVGVYTGICGSEVHGMYIRNQNDIIGYEQTGCVMSMSANRLSYFYSFRGPSKTCDTACSSAAHSLHDAIADISAGRTDYAVVLGSCHILAPNMTLAFHRLHMLSPEGACKAFDAAGNGYVRSEGIAAIVLQRADVVDTPRWAAIQPYCTILNCGINNDGFTKEGITFPSKNAQLVLEKQVCQMAGINPADICYVEAHGTGTVAGDGQEMDAINKWYGKAPGRTEPLLIGSVKSNMGHCEGASCLASVIKLCLSLEYGMLPGNLHFHRDTPNPESEGLREGTLKVCDETQPWDGGLIALSSFGFGGANFHMVMEGRAAERMQLLQSDSSSEDSISEDPIPADNITPLLARTSDGLAYLAKVVTEAEAADGMSFSDPLRRYANSAAADMKLCHRGTLVNGELKAGTPINKAPGVWFAFSGNGSQWPKMGLTLLNNNATFLKSVAACAAVMKPYGIDLMGEFQAENGWKTPLLASVGLIAVQIGLVDVLREDYGIIPDGMLGHSAGEIACTYASGCCNKEQAMLIAYHRGRLPIEHGINTGLMAATGLSAAQAIERTEGTKVVLACDNSPSSTTVSGPAEDVRAFVKELESESIFARVLDTNGVPYHSPVLEPLLPELNDSLRQVMPNPTKRPTSWVSAAFPLDSEDPEAEMCSAGYQVHSYRNPVLFTAAAKDIPKDSLLVEIGPHSILRSPLRQTRPDLSYVGTMRKGDCGVQSLATAIGDMWRKGVSVQWKAEPVPKQLTGAEVPRSIREALTAWDRQLYDVPLMSEGAGPGIVYERQYNLGGEDNYICDHSIDGVVFIPMSCFLVTAWEAFAKWEEKSIWDFPVEFLDVSVYQPVRVERTDKVKLGVIFDFSNRFQVIYEENVICEGTLKKYDADQSLSKEHFPWPNCQWRPKPGKELTGVDPSKFEALDSEHFYSLCLRQNLQYGPKFRSVQRYAVDRTWTDIKWDKNWIIHLDGVFQTTDRLGDHHVHVARGMRRLVISDTMKDVEEGFIDHVAQDTYWKVTRGHTLIMEGYRDEIANSKHKAARTLVHKLTWMPYGERISENEKRTVMAAKLNSLAKQLLGSATDAQLAKVKAAVDKIAAKPLSSSELEALTADSKLASILKDVFAGEQPPSNLEEAISEHPELEAALLEDPVLSGFGQKELDVVLAIAVSNQKTAGYTVGEVGAGSGSFTKQTLKTFITVPQSALLSYTATDKTATSDITKAVQHSGLSYKPWDINNTRTAAPGPFNIVVASNLSSSAKHLPTALASIYNNVEEGGFLLLQEMTGPLGATIFGLDKSAWEHTDGRTFGPCTSVAHWKQLLADAGFEEVTILRCPEDTTAVFLYRKVPAVPSKAVVLEAPAFEADDATMDKWLKDYLAALDEVDPENEGEEPGTVWLYGDTEKSPGLLGFLTSARKEHKGDRVRTAISWGNAGNVNYAKLIEASRKLDLVVNVYEGGKRNGVYAPVETEYKYLKDEKDCPSGAHLNFEVYGNLKSSIWRENRPVPPGADLSQLVSCHVAFGALNFRDVMLAYGKLSKQQMAHESGGDNIGFEFAGTVEGTGKRVMGSAKNALSTKIITRKDLIWEVPESWSLAEAATVPTAYMTAYYSMVMRGHVRKGTRVLIHSGTGAVGLAAIQICLNRGAEVFVTVGTAAKRKFLLETFPGLRDDHIGDSRSTSFEGLVRNLTKNEGVHLVLNSLSDEKLQASVRCLGNWGKLLEIGKYDILKGTPLSMRPMLNNIAFEGIDVDRVMNHPDSTELGELNALVAAGIASGEVKPLPVTVFPRTDIEEAFRYMASGVHIGKVMIDTSATPKKQHTNNCLGPKKAAPALNGHEEATTPLPPLKLEPAFYFRPDRCYIVTGGLGGFGLAVAEFLSFYGAKNIVITSGRGVRDGNQQAALNELYYQKINFRVTTLDVGVPEEAEKIVQLAETLAPVGGIFHLAMYLADKLITNQTGASWNKVMHAKARGAVNLDNASRRLKHLEHFVMWSSFVASAGNEGQTNYGFANACLDVLAEKRRAAGLPALSIQWGVIDHVGVADARIQELMASGLLGASMAQPIDDCLKTLGALMVAGPKSSAVMGSSWQPLDLLGASGGGEAKNVLNSILVVMGLTAAEVNDADTLARLGIDSMQLVEVRSVLSRALGRPVALDEASGMTIASIRALEGSSEEAAPAADSTEEAPAAAEAPGKKTAPVIHPSKIISLEKDMPVKLSHKAGHISKSKDFGSPTKDKSAFKASRMGSASSLNGPPTPEKPSDLLRPMSRYSGDSAASITRSVSPELSPKQDKKLSAFAAPKPPASRKAPAAAGGSEASTTIPAEAEQEYTWDKYSRHAGSLLAVLVAICITFAFEAASGFAAKYGILAALPMIPVVYMASGFTLAAATVIVKSVLLPKFTPGEPVRMWSPDFAKWWVVCRMMETTNQLFMRQFRGTLVLNYFYTLLGAKVAEGAFVDSLDVMDCEFLEIGENAIVGEGTTLIGHTFKDGHIIFNKVKIPKDCHTLPYAIVTPETELKEGTVLAPLSKKAEQSTKDQGGLTAALANEVSSTEMSLYNATIAQVAGLAIPITVASLAAFTGVVTFEKIIGFMGLGLQVTPTAYAVAALIACSNPLVAIFAAFMVPTEAVTISNAVAMLPTLAGACAAIPLAFFAYAITHVVLAGVVKQFLVGKIEPSVHKRNSVYGVNFWISQRLVELTYANVGAIVMGTWALNAMYRLFGANIGTYAIIRKSPAISVPDMLKLGSWTVGGDTSKIVTCMAVDSGRIVAAPVQVGLQGTLGASTVILPGVTVGAQATLAPLAVPALGATIKPKATYMGSPAQAVKADNNRGEPGVDVPLPMHLLALGLPYLQVFIIVCLTIASHVPSAAAAIFFAAYNPGPLGYCFAACIAMSFQSQLMGRMNAKLQDAFGICETGPGVKQWTPAYIIGSATAAVTLFCAGFGECIWKGSLTWLKSLRRIGMEVGDGVYLDNEWIGEPGMVKYAAGAVADRSSIVFGHLMTYNGEYFSLKFNHVNIGPGAVVGPRAAIMPGVNVKGGDNLPSGELLMAF